MDTLIQSYLEETEDLLQKAEECIIRLEGEFSSNDINELFRIAHTIKGSSHMVGYEDIGNLMHKIEDMLDLVRNGSILFNQDIVALCFDGLDIVKQMLQHKAESSSGDFLEEHLEEAFEISEKIGKISANKKHTDKGQETTGTKQDNVGFISSMLNKEARRKNKFFITVVIEEDAPMISPVYILILKNMENIGTLLYSNITDEDLWGVDTNKIRVFEMILSTDIDEAEIYTYFSVFYVEKINVINLNRNLHEINDYYLNETDYSPYLIIFKTIIELYRLVFLYEDDMKQKSEAGDILKQLETETKKALSKIRNQVKSTVYSKEFCELFKSANKIYCSKAGTKKKAIADTQERVIDFIEKMYHGNKGKYIVSLLKLDQKNPINGLKSYINMMNKSSTLILLIDISMLSILHEDEIKDIMIIKDKLQEQGIEVGLIAQASGSRKILNIFDAIKTEFDIVLYTSELEAMLGIFRSTDSSQKLINRIKNIQYE